MRLLLYIGGGTLVGALLVTPWLGYKQEWQIFVPALGALLGAVAYRLSRGRDTAPSAQQPAKSRSLGLGWAFLWLGPMMGAIIGYAIGQRIEDMQVFFPILWLGIFVGVIGFVACLIAR